MSLADRLYRVSPIWLQNAAVSAYGWKLRRLRYGGVHRDELAFLTRVERASAAELDVIQRDRLRRVVARAVRDVPHYRGLGVNPERITPEELAREVPALAKDVVKRDPARFVAEGLARSDTVTIFTSGTSGAPLPVVASRAAIQRNYAFFARFLASAGVAPWDRGATFAGRLVVPHAQSKPPYWRLNRAMNTLLCSSYHISSKSAGAYLDALIRHAPKFVDSYPSAIASLAEFVVRDGRAGELALRAVITSSETLLPRQREIIERAFGGKVRDHYGCAEMTAFITQCEAGSYHVNPEYGIVEILRPDGTAAGPGEMGELCCTGFLNDAMPLLRYMTGDVAAWSPRKCSCGRSSRVVAELVGRLDDTIVTPDGRLVGRLDPVFKGVEGVEEAQIVQVSNARLEVRVVAVPRFDAEAAERLRSAVEQRVGSAMSIDVVRVPSIPRLANGKFRSVVGLASARRDGTHSADVS